MMRILTVLIILLLSLQAQAQLGFCSGSKGDPIFHEDFGSGTGTGEELPPGVTSYTFIEGSDPYDGEYTISDNIGNSITSWHNSLPNSTVSNGRALIVNADFNAGQFYRIGVSGLCENTTYEFSAFLMNVYDRASNVCDAGGIPINVRFEIWDETDSVLLKSGNTGDIQSSLTAEWEQYALTFSSEPGQEGVILKMFNNGEGGCGNDLAIDDIIFRSCGDLTSISSDVGSELHYEVCEENSPAEIRLEAVPDFSVYEEHYFQWQQSFDGENWRDIAGENSSVFEEDEIETTTYFRVKVAEDPANLLSNVCSSASQYFQVQIFERPDAPASGGNISICSNESIPELRVSANENEEVFWFDSAAGGNLLAENSTTYKPETEGTYFAEARLQGLDCAASPRTEVKLSIFEIPEVTDELLQLCPDTMLELDAGIEGMEYSWNTGETSQDILVDSPGTYFVEVSNSNGCSSLKTIEVINVPNASILEVISDDASVEIIPEFEGDFEYSLDGLNFQESNYFDFVEGGIYTAYIRDLAACQVEQIEFPHIVIPKFITPNNDGYNDEFRIKGLNYFESSVIRIFDRYGKLLKVGPGTNFSWTGQYNGAALPAADYWYEIRIDGYPPETGNFSLVR
ncbi:T9SS type B sorting domain-containing protein [Gramella sp. GC03-9]|uniref:T9SS type B sorting domain-containing protein n=1 Tax=Christiangramia oceanisediminis TaxID=2920386 RepID=A0A9X2R8L7_9FLAO|nr:T9SS type B sorting domain-containing protein [Gramella oceanisediminis]MCP9200363.1 T9SS type B sorting domain-containing protein [Gramella oceanisediminis]